MGPDLRRLFAEGTVAGRSDGELLDRFLAASGPAAEPAFAALVERHGPMVWRVCRDVLRESNDADDAFQAAFLVLVRRAGAIRKRSSLGPWLYGVALRVARCARTSAARRRTREQGAAGPEWEEALSDVDRLDAAAILHEEVGRLPEKYRAPLVLCYFEGLTHDQAASQLGWPVGTVRSRLAEARERLRPRLVRRGVAPSVAILAATGRAEAAAAVPVAVVLATVEMATGAGAAGTVPAAVAALLGTALREMTLMKLSTIAISLVAGALVGTAGVALLAAQPRKPGNAATPGPDVPVAGGGAPGFSPIAPGRDRLSPAGSSFSLPAGSPRVVWARLNSAVQNLQILAAQHQAANADYRQVVAARGELEALAAELDTSADDLRDEVELLEAQRAIREADVRGAEAHLAKANDSYKYTNKLHTDKMVSANEVRSYQQDVDIRSAELAKKQAELKEVAIRIKQATRRRDEAITLVERAKKLVPEPKATQAPAAKP